MSEVTRFRLARAVQRRMPAADAIIRVVRDSGENPGPTEFVETLQQVVTAGDNRWERLQEEAENLHSKVRWFVDPDVPGTPTGFNEGEIPEGNPTPPYTPFIDELRKLDAWLAAKGNEPRRREVTEELESVVDRLGLDVVGDNGDAHAMTIVAEAPWSQARDAIGDSLQAVLILTSGEDPKVQEITVATRLLRLLLVAGLVEAFASPELYPDNRRQVLRLLRDRIVVLPNPPFPLSNYLPRRARLARPPGWADLWVVRDEWACFLPGEIAHIENVLEGELKERVHTRTDETEITETVETETTRVTEQDSQTTTRFTLDEETSRESQLAISVDGQVDTSGQYGPTRVETHLGGSLDYSIEESRQHATELAQEAVQRAVTRVEERTREEQVRRTLTRVKELNRHSLDNTSSPDGHVVGIYRWVDKVQRLQMFRYPNRYLLEFEIPEPAAYLRWLRSRTQGVEIDTPPPPPFTRAFTEGGDEEPADGDSKLLSPADITRQNYGKYASRFRASNLSPPRDQTVWVSDAVAVEMEDKTADETEPPAMLGPPTASKTQEMIIPDGYRAVEAQASFSGPPIHAIWRDHPKAPWDGDGWHYRDGYHTVRADVTLAGTTLIVEEKAHDVSVEPSTDIALPEYRGVWLELITGPTELPMKPVQKTKVGVTMAGTYRGSVSVALKCELLQSAKEAWRLEIFTKLLDAHRAWQSQYDNEKATAAIGEGIAIAGMPPERNEEIVREELKRLSIEMLMGERFKGYDALTNGDDSKPPRIELDKAAAAAPLIQFLEQAFEWEKLVFVLYPYFWGWHKRWEKLQDITDPDPEMVRFLRSGSARVVVSARRGFEHAVNHFLISGVPWNGGPAPAPDHPLYLSVAQEIRDLTGAPDDAEPGESWEVRLPTTLVWLDPDPKLPKLNTRARLRQPEGAAAVCSFDVDQARRDAEGSEDEDVPPPEEDPSGSETSAGSREPSEGVSWWRRVFGG